MRLLLEARSEERHRLQPPHPHVATATAYHVTTATACRITMATVCHISDTAESIYADCDCNLPLNK